ncbi:transposase [Streptomyces sp. BE147]|uniref:IS701 family transposase n=1 Tax=unclassified Streptomyces TaxID=2593676 RepID=UPI002E795B52|nr:transposase [Streptomyces sp. BE147]MEE1740452.1 transposase [Streptomyces sp. BE147]
MLTSSDDLSRFCAFLFTSMSRADQRRWGEVYVRGLVEVPGRKSVRRISEWVLGQRADQSLQQFVNQSSWAWEPVRRNLGQETATALRPTAWVVGEVVMPKNGKSSVGVDRQFSQTAGRVLNCQLGLTVMLVCPDGSVPINWRLLLPPSWDADEERRSRSRVPGHERHRSRWHYLFEALDEMVLAWGMQPPPVVVEARGNPSADLLIRGLEIRGLQYIVRASATAPLARLESGEVVTGAGGLARSAGRRGTTQHWCHGRPRGPRYVTAPLPPGTPPYAAGGAGRPQRARKVIAECPPDRGGPESVWITNVEVAQTSAVFGFLSLQSQAARELEQLSETAGLRHFEGRSFCGWHHHVTLVSAAHAYGLSRRAASS